MFDPFQFQLVPGRLFLLATFLPLLPVPLLLLIAIVRNLTRTRKEDGGAAATTYWLLGGDRPLPLGGYLCVACLIAAAVLAICGAVIFANDVDRLAAEPQQFEARWSERTDWVRIGPAISDTPANALQLGYRIDRLTVLMFVMVTVVGSLVFLFALGYLADELQERVPLPHEIGHGHRRGRFSRFFLFLSLFAFSMLNLLIADNLFQVFVSWELVGVCSFWLIGFYYEKPSAAFAANKAFLMNRVGDAGLLLALGIAFGTFGTLNIRDLIAMLEAGHPPGLTPTLWLLMGLGLFLGCVGKSAQVPLQTWLPDAMEGPTPVSALIHAATMVAAGVYLVGRCYPLLSPEVLLVIAYVGLITLVLSATMALVSTDIKRVLAFSTGSQLGFMMLALGVGGWAAGLFHLLTHAVFKALLFLCAGSVIHGLHHEQDLRKMGGLRRKMPITAYAMLIGVLAISGMPLLSGWYSKEQILGAALGYGLDSGHYLLFIGPFLTAGLTAFYMFRLWFLAFAGEPRDQHLYDHAHESPLIMTLPLMILALLSVGLAWGQPVWNADASILGHMVQAAAPVGSEERFHHAHELAEKHHLLVGGLAFGALIIGFGIAWLRYARRIPNAAQLAEPRGLFANRWYFDRIYDAIFVRGTIALAATSAAFDKSNPDKPTRRGTLDGVMNWFADVTIIAGSGLRFVQSGRIRGYVLVLMLSLVGLLGAIVVMGY